MVMICLFKRIKKILVITILFPAFSFAQIESGVKQKAEIVFCLDLSASTNGLLNDIRDNLWQFMNSAKRNFPETDVRIGIVGFARPSFGPENNYAKVLCDITEDNDLISYYLFLLKANVEKGDQCDGSALYVALKDIHWSKDASVKKMIYLFGNGNVKLCGYDYRKACEIATKENIPIHAVFCSRGANDMNLLSWNEIAVNTAGEFFTYQVTGRTSLKTVSNDAQRLCELNNNFLDTYIYCTREGKLQFDLMVAADENSKKMNEQFFYERCAYKFLPLYQEQTRKWDAVSIINESYVDVLKLNRNYMSDEFKNSTLKELKEIAQIKMERRESLKKQMQDILLNSNIDNLPVNPIDSIFLTGLNKKSVLASGKLEK